MGFLDEMFQPAESDKRPGIFREGTGFLKNQGFAGCDIREDEFTQPPGEVLSNAAYVTRFFGLFSAGLIELYRADADNLVSIWIF